MEKVDRLGWVDGFAFSPHGVRIGIRTNDRGCLDELERIVKARQWQLSDEEEVQILFSLRVAPPARPGRRNFHLLYLGASRLVRNLELREVVSYLERHLPEIVMATARDAVFVHGAIVASKGRTLVLPGQPGSGVDKLVARLRERGAQILAEDYFTVTPDGQLCLKTCEAETPLILFTEYSPGRKRIQTKDLTPGDSSIQLFASGLSCRTRPQLALGALANFAARSETLQGQWGNDGQAAEWILGDV